MLTELTIKDFAIIDELHLTFDDGFNVLTGETGAGKSIILDAVSLLLGARADNSMVRSGNKQAIIEGVFVVKSPDVAQEVDTILHREEIDSDASEQVIISREVKTGGRSTARINGFVTNLNILQEVGFWLIDIHGQGDHMSLMKPAAQLQLIDRYAGLVPQRDAFAEKVRQVEKVRATLKHLKDNEKSLKQRAELLAYQVEEISSSKLKPGEDETLTEDAKRLANAEQLATLSTEAYQAVYAEGEDGSSATEKFTVAASALARLVRFDPDVSDLAELAEDISIKAEELARSLADYEETIEFDPLRLQETEMRLDRINQLKRKYGADSIEDLIALGESAAAELATIDNSDQRILELQEEEAALLQTLGAEGAALSRARAEAAETLSQYVEAELSDLKMQDARFSVAIEQVDDPHGVPVGDYRVAFDSTGIDRVEFLLAPNMGESLKSMAKIASGGETSRIMLALKTVLTRADDTPVLIFDEIDTGIGGRIGAIIGQKLWSLSLNHQVLVVTHLPQLAGFGDLHLKVEKSTDGKRTRTFVRPLDEGERVSELAEMLGAEASSAHQNAEEILTYVQGIKHKALSV